MAVLYDEAPGDLRYGITVAGLRALGRDIPHGLRDDQLVNDTFLQAIADRPTARTISPGDAAARMRVRTPDGREGTLTWCPRRDVTAAATVVILGRHYRFPADQLEPLDPHQPSAADSAVSA